MTITPGTQLGAYEILSPLGAGGMGEVHRARDTRLNREVAIKVLPADFAKDADRLRRFEQEALATSALNHPNILTIYEFGSVSTEAGATHFLASEFIDGETLRDRLQRAPLPLNEAIDIAVQTAQALAAAHEANIIHRDIKPENVMLRKDGIVKVLDFGLAKLTERRGDAAKRGRGEEADTLLAESPRPPVAESLTMPGTVMGTVAYMSPEQARGQTVDARTDLFSLGVMLYEMLARRQPFTGETVNHVIVAILEKEPPPLAGVPAELTRILAQALAKQAAERFGSAQAMLADLKKLQTRLLVEAENKRNSADDAPVEAQTLIQPQATAAAPEALATAAASAPSTSPDHPKPKQWWLAAGLGLLLAVGGYFGYGYFTATRQINSIAIMPFENKNSDADTDYLSDGLAEALIYRLSQLPDLKVSPTNSVFRYKGKETDPQVVAKELGVDSVMTGRITQRGDSLTISVNLVDTRNSKSLWGEQYERKLSQILTTQREMVAEIVSKLQLKLSGESEQKLAKKYTDNNEAYQLYLQGRFHWNRRWKEELEKAVVFFKQAIEKDPNYALAYSGLADAYTLIPSTGDLLTTVVRPKEYLLQAKAAAQTALKLDPNLAEAHASLGKVLMDYEYDFAGAEKSFKRAIELNPNYATAHQWYAELLFSSSRHDEASRAATKALELDQFAVAINLAMLFQLQFARRFDEALSQAKKVNELFPNPRNFHHFNSNIYAAQGKYDQAVEEYLLSAKANKDFKPENIAKLKEAYEQGGWDGFGRMRQEISIERLNARQAKDPNGYVGAYEFASAYAWGKNKDKTIEYLNKAYDERESWLVALRVGKNFDFVRDDPRFKELVRKVGIPE
ncbi:MAG: protein kinase [Blastocatellia bacterium]|nr:protein kinase [Blastocatellia bacterium]